MIVAGCVCVCRSCTIQGNQMKGSLTAYTALAIVPMQREKGVLSAGERSPGTSTVQMAGRRFLLYIYFFYTYIYI